MHPAPSSLLPLLAGASLLLLSVAASLLPLLPVSSQLLATVVASAFATVHTVATHCSYTRCTVNCVCWLCVARALNHRRLLTGMLI